VTAVLDLQNRPEIARVSQRQHLDDWLAQPAGRDVFDDEQLVGSSQCWQGGGARKIRTKQVARGLTPVNQAGTLYAAVHA
jgi:hypothetical protein